MLNRRNFLVSSFALTAPSVAFGMQSIDRDTPFTSIDGGEIRLSDWQGQPVLVVNTASLCGFADQFTSLQTLYDRYRSEGLIVLAIPSDDFNQELQSNDEVKDYCEIVFGLDLPMTTITKIRGRNAHPFYSSLQRNIGFVPRWNFNKVLLDREGQVVSTFDARIDPLSRQITTLIEELL